MIAKVYDEICIWFGVRIDYWRNRVWTLHRESLSELTWLLEEMRDRSKNVG